MYFASWCWSFYAFEQLSLTDQLFDAALAELSVVARGHPCMLVGDFNVEPTKIPCQAKGISAGLWVDLEGSWALATGKQPSSTCMREWGSSGGTRRDFIVGWPLSAAAVLSCTVQADRWIAPHLAVLTLFDYERWSCCVTQPVRFSPLWPASWLLAIDKSRGSTSVEVRRVWEIYDDRLQFMSQRDAFLLNESLDVGDVSQAWLVWLLKLLLQMLVVFLEVLLLVKVWFLGVVLLVFGMFGLAVTRFVRFVVMLLMSVMLLVFSCIEILLSLLCLI